MYFVTERKRKRRAGWDAVGPRQNGPGSMRLSGHSTASTICAEHPCFGFSRKQSARYS